MTGFTTTETCDHAALISPMPGCSAYTLALTMATASSDEGATMLLWIGGGC